MVAPRPQTYLPGPAADTPQHDDELPEQLGLALPMVGRSWPDPARFPHNADDSRVGDRLAADYWLAQGISITQWPALLGTIRLVETGALEVRTSGARRIHAKVYAGDGAVTLGSSSYTDAGLSQSMEANVRFTEAEQPERFAELLSGLLVKVRWQEALARAYGEILEGD